jgi:SPP1 gp7 family putative phage head morphogenesis protein
MPASTKEVTLYGPNGQTLELSKKGIEVPDLDPMFFNSVSGNNINTREVERKPYQLHWLIYACARTIAWNLCVLPRVLRDEDEKKVENPEIKKLFSRPNPFMTGRTFWEAVLLYLLLPAREGFGRGMKGGQCFLICDSGKEDHHCDLAAGDIPAVIYPYTDEFVSPEYDGQKRFIGWKLEIVQGGILEHYKPHEIIRIYNFNPYDWLRGLSMYEPAQFAILNDIKADVWNSRTFENDAVPNGVLSSDQELTSEQAIQIQKEWYEKYGFANARRIAVLGKGAKFQNIALSQKDMEFKDQKDSVVEQGLAAFGLNKIAIGKYEQINYATIVEGRRMLWEDTYLPIDSSVMEQLNSQWIQNIDVRKPIHLSADTSNVRVLKKDYTKSVTASKSLYDMGVPTAIACRINEVPLSQDDLAACPWLNEQPQNKAPLPPQFAAPENEPKLLKSQPLIVKIGFSVDALDKIAADYIERVLQPGENTFYAKMIRFFNDERNYLQDLVDEWLKQQKDKDMRDLSSDMFSLDQEKENDKLIRKIYRPQVKSQLIAEASKLKEELGTLVNWGVSDDMIEAYVLNRAEGLAAINTTTIKMYHDKISEAIAEGYQEVWTPQQFAKGIKEAISDTGEIRKNQARTIARTETGIISSDARFDAFKEEGIENHQWVSAGDEKVRETHAAENGNVVPVGETFPETGLEHPCDADGPAEEICNCRCTTVAVQEGK